MKQLEILPHRFPFMAVDRVIEVVPGRKAIAAKNVTADGYYGRGGQPAFPELLLLEAMAQVGALAAAAGVDNGPGADGEMEPGYLASIQDAVFHGMPQPGETVVFTLDFQARLGPLARFIGTAAAGGRVIATSILTFTLPVRSK